MSKLRDIYIISLTNMYFKVMCVTHIQAMNVYIYIHV